jgi:hypothetical protein
MPPHLLLLWIFLARAFRELRHLLHDGVDLHALLLDVRLLIQILQHLGDQLQ